MAIPSEQIEAKVERFARRPSAKAGMVDGLLEFVGEIPPPQTRARVNAHRLAERVAKRASLKTAAAAGVLALPPGFVGWLTIAPELYAVWKMQRQMVSDIAGLYGASDRLTREHMLYCLFGHTAAGAFRDVVIRAGERFVVRRAPLSALYAIANKIVLRIAQRGATRMLTRWVPVAGSVGIAGYVYLDTNKVAETAMSLFASERVIEGDAEIIKPGS
jgi:hypothetical protein